MTDKSKVVYNVAVLALTAFIIWITGSLWGLLVLFALSSDEVKRG